VAANIVANIMANNDPPIGPGRVLGFANLSAANAWAIANIQRVPGTYEFFTNVSAQSIEFGLQVVRRRELACYNAWLSACRITAERHDQEHPWHGAGRL
jgi:hypothetical protein